MPVIETGPETLHVFAVDLSMPKATALAESAQDLRASLGVDVDPERVRVVDPRALGEISLASYLAEGEGVEPEAMRAEAGRINAVSGPVLILLPRAARETMHSKPPLSHVGSFAMERGRPAGAPIRTASAASEGQATGVPPGPPEPGTDRKSRDRRQSGVVAMVALGVALLVAFVMWVVAT